MGERLNIIKTENFPCFNYSIHIRQFKNISKKTDELTKFA